MALKKQPKKLPVGAGLTLEPVLAFVDGSIDKDGYGGLGMLIYDPALKHKVYPFYAGYPNTTGNRMELRAALTALISFIYVDGPGLHVFSDSEYVVKGTELMYGWSLDGWTTSEGGIVANQDLWKMMIAKQAAVKAEFFHVKGHSGIAGNELADRLASIGRLRFKNGLIQGGKLYEHDGKSWQP